MKQQKRFLVWIGDDWSFQIAVSSPNTSFLKNEKLNTGGVMGG